ncbi:hypothetical protein GCM10008107_28640 [Psychrosphaera saromensis]|uniref:Uncharacterized protein n=1 Tax=Psychrosphaera saromensis TaxID=716813 RepID=A0A2S7UUP0_9GAMM|nr:hypothetical protein [Psychrosphaera saromensis]PQJ52990.1 hypothetical protein BTO11_04510 [Psychrosphaera saromensis]GHB77404.1 hypothetical protein GCM10008107_28640 [Psychrosphaera saromensis]GLQ12849.1 hypothetical protein GCM10007917_03040 [Psychrosphaera saromensis]
MNLNGARFNLMHTVRNTMINKIKALDMNLSPMHLKSLKIISTIDDCTGQKLAGFMGRDKGLNQRIISQNFLIKKDNEKDKRSE